MKFLCKFCLLVGVINLVGCKEESDLSGTLKTSLLIDRSWHYFSVQARDNETEA